MIKTMLIAAYFILVHRIKDAYVCVEKNYILITMDYNCHLHHHLAGEGWNSFYDEELETITLYREENRVINKTVIMCV